MSLEYQFAHLSDNYQPQLIAATVVCLTAAYASVVVRFISRKVGHVKFGYDDISIVSALVGFLIKSQNALGHCAEFV